jgi:hypothetical protein
MDEAPWGDLHGKPLDARGLARWLRPYDVRPRDVRIDGVVVKGYRAEDLADPWARYLASTPTPPGSATRATSATGHAARNTTATATPSVTSDVADVALVALSEGERQRVAHAGTNGAEADDGPDSTVRQQRLSL